MSDAALAPAPRRTFNQMQQAWVESPGLMLEELNANARLSMADAGVILMTPAERWQLYASVFAAVMARHCPLAPIPE